MVSHSILLETLTPQDAHHYSLITGREKKAFPTGEQSSNVNRPVMGHRSTRSVSSLPSDLQKLSLYPSSKDDSAVQPSSPLPFTSNKPPSWAQPPATQQQQQQQQHQPSPPAVLLPPLPTTATPSLAHPQPPHRRNGHGRSVSEYTLPPQPPPSFPPTTGISAAGIHHHHHHHPQPRPPMIPSFERHPATAAARTHRRAVSANTVDFMLRPPAPTTPSSSSSSSSSSTHNNSMMRAQSDSPPEQRLRSPPLQDADDQHPQLQRDASSGRYLCPYCNKGFSRPSSLRIHTYSHTGEKPYVCTEDGCGRRFSVQSNMRRHLRVHRMGRASMKPSPLRKP